MSELKDALRQVGERVPMPEPALDRLAQRRDRRQRNERISTVFLGLVITVALVLALASSRSPFHHAPATTPSPPASNGMVAYTLPDAGQGPRGGIYLVAQGQAPRPAIGREGAFEECPAFSPDGTRLTFTRRGDLAVTSDVFVVDVDGAGIVDGSERPVATARSRPCPEWAPNGQRLLYADEEGLWTVDVDGNAPPVLIWRSDRIGDAEWSPDGSLVAFTSDAYVWIVSARDGAFVAQTHGIPHGELSWSPTGDRIAVGQAAVDQHDPVWLIDVGDGEREKLVASGRTFDGYGSPRWSPNGASLALLDESGDADQGILIVRPGDDSWYRIPLPPVEAPTGGRLEVWALRWSPDGRRLLVASGCSVHSIAADGSGEAILLSSPNVDPQACLSPPGIDWQPVFP
jgi:Tol biopolymer transport system component